MKVKSMKIITYLLLIICTSMQIIGCGSNSGAEPPESSVPINDMAAQQQEIRDSYISEKIILPHQSIYYETVTDDILYYLNNLPSEESGGPAEKTAVCSVAPMPGQAEPAELPFTLEEGQTAGRITADGNGAVFFISSRYVGTGAESRVDDMFLTKIDTDGTVSAPVSIMQTLGNPELPYVSSLEVDLSGNLCLVSEGTITMVRPDGSLIGQIAGGGQISHLCRDDMGKLYALWTQADTLMIAEVDSAALTLINQRELPELRGILGAGPGPGGQLVFATDSGVYDYDWEAKTLTERFRWLTLDLAVDMYDQVYPLSDGRILLVSRLGDQWGSETTDLALIRARRADEPAADPDETEPAESSEAAKGQTPEVSLGDTGDIVLGITGRLDATIKEAIVTFNQSHPDGRIEVKEYGTEDYEAGITQLNADIVSGNCPDVLILPSQLLSKDLYGTLGILEDLNPYIDADSSLKRTDYQENIMEAYETGEKLYCLPITFSIDTVMGRTSSLNGRTNWNLDEMIAYTDEVGQDNNLFLNPTKSAVLDLCMKANSDSIVNWTDAEGSFQRDLFIKMLEFSNRFMPDEQFTDDMLAQRFMSQEIFLIPGGVSPLTNQYDRLGEPTTFIGYPSENGSGSLVDSYSAAAISSTCQAKGTAWSFLRSLLSEEVQSSPLLEAGYPILKSSLEKQIEQTKEASGWIMSSSADGEIIENFELRGATDEEVETFQNLIDSVDKAVTWDEQISRIITEEAGAYFNNSKTAEEVADIVENRINVYVSEKR